MVTAPTLALPTDDEGPSRPAVAAPGSRRPVDRRRMLSGSGLPRSRSLSYSARPALACIIGGRRACTVEMISSEEILCR
jgi:hypothetical protein